MSAETEAIQIPEGVECVSDSLWRIKKGFVPGMNVDGYFYLNEDLTPLIFQELEAARERQGGFIPSLVQLSNVATLPGIVKGSFGMPDMHSGYGFSIGGVAAFDAEPDGEGIVSPGGVGFDINCGVRVIRTNLTLSEVRPVVEELAQKLYDNIPVGVGSRGMITLNNKELDEVLELGMDWAIRKGYAWPGDKEHCEEGGRMLQADASKLSKRAKKRGLKQLGTLGAGNHYIEVQRVEEILDETAARTMGFTTPDQIAIMIHTGSRGLGHQVATDAVQGMMDHPDHLATIDPQLVCAPIQSEIGQDYLAAMACAANYAFCNRQAITFMARQAFAEVFHRTPEELDMALVYDVSHNIAKLETHIVDGVPKQLLVHRKGATRAFPPHHPLVPATYQFIGQPVIIGGSMGTASYILCGTQKGFEDTFGSTCHGAGRAMSRSKTRRELDPAQVLAALQAQGIVLRMASPKLATEEADAAYKDVDSVVGTCETTGISKRVVKLRPVIVVKG